MTYDPTLSLATAALEVAAAVWTLRSPGRKSLTQPVAAILTFLAAYQIIEAIFCSSNAAVSLSFLPKMAFMVVAWLPPMGLLLVSRLYPANPRWVKGFAFFMFLVCTVLVVGIALDRNFVTASVCLIVFARYQNPTPLYQAYGIFYQSGLLSMLLLSANGVTNCEESHTRRLLGQVLLGSIAFIIPSLVTVAVIPVTEAALPSIMCHFALLLAAFLTRLAWMERNAGMMLDHTAPLQGAHAN